ncbi:hypothetical protein cypCar_00037797, partial [Cyprinus carpio]
MVLFSVCVRRFQCCDINTSRSLGRGLWRLRKTCYQIVDGSSWFETYYLHDPPQQGALVSVIGLVARVVSYDQIGSMRVLRTLRALRPLRAVSRFAGMRVSLVSLVANTLGYSDFAAIKSLRTLRALRPLRALSRFEGMR